MKKLILAILAICLVAGVAWATSPHFVKSNISIDRVGCLSSSFKEAGLGDNLQVEIHLSANATVTWQCVNHGGNCPQASNKTTVVQQVSADGIFSVKNGQVTGNLLVCPPEPPDTFGCPGNQVISLAAIQYTNIVLKDVTNNVQVVFPQNLSKDFGVCP